MKLIRLSMSSCGLVLALAVTETCAFTTNTKAFGVSASSKSHVLSNYLTSTSLSAAAAMPDGPSDNNWENSKNLPSSSMEDLSSSSKSQFSQDGMISDEINSRQILPEDLPDDDAILNNDVINTDFTTPASRLERIEREEKVKSRFLHGDELTELRKYITNLEADLEDASEKNDVDRLSDLTKALYDSKKMDAEHVYQHKLSMAKTAKEQGLHYEAEEYHMEAMEARNCLPQFNLGGLWVGKYGEHGYEMINVTYVEDTIIATKITGDQNVPKGEVTFKADLSPEAEGRGELEPIELSDVAAKQWGHKHLPRFPGKGQVAGEGFVNNQWMDGQLILVGEYFSFAWIPLGHQIFFGRPSAELTLKMLKQSKMSEYGAKDAGSPNAVAEMRAFAQRCFEESEMLADDEVEGELCFLVDDDEYFCQDGCFE